MTARILPVLFLAFLVTASGCQTRNPAAVATEEGDSEAELQAAEQTAAFSPEREALSRGAEPATSTQNLDPGQRLDVGALLSANTLRIVSNDEPFDRNLANLFDRDTDTLAKSEKTNPLLLSLDFDDEITLTSVRLFPSYSTYDWVLVAPKSGARLLLSAAPPAEWTQIDLPKPVETRSVTLELLRLERDDYVHLNEIELYLSD